MNELGISSTQYLERGKYRFSAIDSGDSIWIQLKRYDKDQTIVETTVEISKSLESK